MEAVAEKDKEILETFSKVVPKLSTMEKEKLLSFGEGLAFSVQLKEKGKEE